MRKIICSAIWYEKLPIKNEECRVAHLPENIKSGFVIAGRRHYNCIALKSALTGLRDCECGYYVQGFLTSDNYFVNRQVAYEIAYGADQIIGPNKGHSENSIGLTSEDLY